MSIQASCDSCGSTFKVRDEMAGKRGKCPRCGNVFQVVDPTLPPPQDQGEHPRTPAPESAPPAYSSRVVRSSGRPRPAPAPQSPEPRVPPVLPGAPRPSVAPQLAPSPAPAAAASDSRIASYASRHKNRLRVPVWAWFVVAGVGMIGAVGFAWHSSQESQRQADRRPEPPRRNDRLNRTPLLTKAGLQPSVADIPKPPEGASLEQVIEYVNHAIVKIDATGNTWYGPDGIGSGFLIDKRGLVATNYHVVSGAMKADVLFKDGTRYGVEGYVALRPDLDLAVLQLNGVPPQATALDLAGDEDPHQASDVAAVGHPHGYAFSITKGIVSRVLRTPELPEQAQAFLRGHLGRDTPNNRWIQHEAHIEPGNSGGPLLNMRGDVLGVNTWKNEIGANFAIHVAHLRETLRDRLPTVEPLYDHMRSHNPDLAAEGQQDLTPDLLRRIYEVSARKGFRPETAEDYEQIHQMALLYTFCKRKLLQLKMDADQRAAWQRELDSISKALRQVAWDTQTQIPAINKFATATHFEAGMGAFVFGEVQQIFVNGDKRVLSLKIEPGAKTVLVPLLEADAPDISRGTRCLVVGVCLGSRSVGDNPADQVEVPQLLNAIVAPLVGDAVAAP